MENEIPRYNKIIDFIKDCEIENPRILDLGCGFGSLSKYLKAADFSNLLGVDLYDTAIAMAKKKKYLKSEFIVSDIQKFSTDQKFDIIVLNEVIYYLDDYNKTVLNLKKLFKYKEGFFIVSIYGIREDIIKKLSESYDLIKTEKVVRTDNKAWGVSLFKVNLNN